MKHSRLQIDFHVKDGDRIPPMLVFKANHDFWNESARPPGTKVRKVRLKTSFMVNLVSKKVRSSHHGSTSCCRAITHSLPYYFITHHRATEKDQQDHRTVGWSINIRTKRALAVRLPENTHLELMMLTGFGLATSNICTIQEERMVKYRAHSQVVHHHHPSASSCHETEGGREFWNVIICPGSFFGPRCENKPLTKTARD